MSNFVRSAALFVCVLWMSSAVAAQVATPVVSESSSPIVTAAAAAGMLRFGSSVGVVRIRAQVTGTNDAVLFDSGWQEGNVLDCPIQTLGPSIGNGVFRCVVIVSNIDGRTTQKQAVLVLHDGQVSLERETGSDTLTIIGADDTGPRVTLPIHDGKDGSIVSNGGDLRFRLGDFFAARDVERMRLTSEGNLGIGTDKPQATLDVNGFIRTTRGIMFPDGTVMLTAAGLPHADFSSGAKPAVVLTPTSTAPVGPGPLATVRTPRSATSPVTGAPRSTSTPDYQFKADSTGVHIGTTRAYGLDVFGDVSLASNLGLSATSATTGVITVAGTPFVHSFGTDNVFIGNNAGNFTLDPVNALQNIAVGTDALSSITEGYGNVGMGAFALASTSGQQVGSLAGSYNTGVGDHALFDNTTGFENTASGASALIGNITGYRNTAIGDGAMAQNQTGYENTAIGFSALESNASGIQNTIIGDQALLNGSGSNNVVIGFNAGFNVGTGSNDICVGSAGGVNESNSIRIGDAAKQSKTFIAGIRNVTTGSDAVPVLIDSNGQLGTASSSRRYKYDIADMDDATDGLMRLRPVTFRYLAHGENAPLQYGLIAEEVANVYPELVARNNAGEVESVMYQFLPPMLLNEVQKQQRQIDDQAKAIQALMTTVDALKARLESVESRVTVDNPHEVSTNK